ncbi:MAG: ammonium transporter [Bacteroidota bacterium]
MKKTTPTYLFIFILFFLFIPVSKLFAVGPEFGKYPALEEAQQYDRAIHIMAMLLVGFGFLMVFLKKYGRSALTATFLLVSVAIPMYFFFTEIEPLARSKGDIEKLILSEFGAASLLIAAGALLGRIKMHQYIILGLLFIPFYMINEWIILENGIGLMPGAIADTGGSVIIHTFGALFGVAAAVTLSQKKDLVTPMEADATSDRYSMIGSMVLWIFWPSFCAALVPAELVSFTVVNVILALCGSTIITYLLSKQIRGKINIADIANAALAGGVAIGATCDHATHGMAVVIGVLAGAISTVGFAWLQSKQQNFLKAIDTCGVSNLHGLPGIFGGLAAIPLVAGISAGGQLMGIAITISIAILGGLLTGKIISLFGSKDLSYVDSEEFGDAE